MVHSYAAAFRNSLDKTDPDREAYREIRLGRLKKVYIWAENHDLNADEYIVPILFKEMGV